MPVTCVAATAGQTDTSSTGIAQFSSGPPGKDRMLLVMTWKTNWAIESCVYAGKPMTLAASSGHARLWRLMSPTPGVNQLALQPGNEASQWAAAVYEGVHQAAPLGAPLAAAGATGTASAGHIDVPAGGLVFGAMVRDHWFGGGAPSVLAPSVSRVVHGNDAVGRAMADRSTSGAVEFAVGSAVAWNAFGVAINPADRPTVNATLEPCVANSGSGVRLGQAFVYSAWLDGAAGAMSGKAPVDGVGETDQTTGAAVISLPAAGNWVVWRRFSADGGEDLQDVVA